MPKRGRQAGEAAGWAVMAMVVFGMGWIGSAWLKGQQAPKIEVAGPSASRSAPAPKAEDEQESSPWFNTARQEELRRMGFSEAGISQILKARNERQGFVSLDEMLKEAGLSARDEARAKAAK